MKTSIYGTALAASFLLIGGAGQVWAVDWGECQRTEASKLQPVVVIPACSRIIDSGEANQADLAVAHYRRGRGYHKEEDFDRAFADYNRAIELNPNLSQAYYSRAVAHYNKGELERAIVDYNKAAEQGHAGAQYILGAMYDYGEDVPQDYAEAAKWYRLAAEQGDSSAQTNLGRMYFVGLGVPQDAAEALKWYRLAAEQGESGAQRNLGLMYMAGDGVQKDDAEAVKWFRLAAEQGIPLAQFNLGVMYANGQGVEQDYAEAVKWYRMAAEQGEPVAQRNLGIAYAQGNGVSKDDDEAKRWFGLAAAQGDAEAQARLDSMAQGLPVIPTLEHVLGVPAQNLAAGYLAVDATMSMAEMALTAGFTVNLTLDGEKVTITGANAESYLTAYKQRLEIYRQAIEQRGFAEIAGRYALDVAASCRGDEFDMGEMFATGMRNGEPVIADELVIRQAGFKTDLVLSANNDGQSQEIVFPGAAVEDGVIFSAPTNLGFNFWGVVEKRAVRLRLNIKEVQDALGAHIASESDWRALADCVFTLTPQ